MVNHLETGMQFLPSQKAGAQVFSAAFVGFVFANSPKNKPHLLNQLIFGDNSKMSFTFGSSDIYLIELVFSVLSRAWRIIPGLVYKWLLSY